MWSNHHHMLKGARHPDLRLLWANNNLLFWMSLGPFVTAYLAAHPLGSVPVSVYGICLAVMSLAFAYLRGTILRQRHKTIQEVSAFQWRMQAKNIGSVLAYATGAALAFVDVRLSYAVFIAIPIMYFLLDSSLAVEGPK